MKPFGKRLILLVIAVGILAGVVLAFLSGRKEAATEAEREKPVKAPTRVEMVNDENVVTFDAATRANSGVVLGRLAAATNRLQLRAYGIVVDLQDLIDLRNGVENAKARLGKSQAALDVAQKDYERVRMLYDKNQNVSQKTVQTAEGTLRAEEANVQSAQAALNVAQATALQHWGRVLAGWLVQGAPEFERLRLQKDLLVQATLSPGQMMADAPANASIQTAGDQLIEARLVSAAPRTDPKIQGRSFFYRVPADEGGLLPGMNVTALLPAGEPARGAVVPDSAVVWLQGKPWVYVQTAPDKFARREITTEQPVNGGWFQFQGFAGGEEFVSQGPQALLSEEFRAQISVGD